MNNAQGLVASKWTAWGKAWRSVYLRNRLFYGLGLLMLLYALAFAWLPLLVVAHVGLAVLCGFAGLDLALLFARRQPCEGQRALPRLLSLGDDNVLRLTLRNRTRQPFRFQVVDELPYQLQIRDFTREGLLAPGATAVLDYSIRPLQRGVYRFGQLHVFLRTSLGLAERRVSVDSACEVPVYPSLQQMRRFELLALANVSRGQGLRKIRRIGHSYEFEQIKSYVAGDDRRAINWKATSKRSSLMVNQYEDERSQQIYCAIDTGRSMKLPFGGMSLLDYAVNASLVLCNVALRKHDRAGLVCFDKSVHTAVLAERKRTQLPRLLEALYRQEEHHLEADFELFYRAFARLNPARSLLVLFSNFESDYALQRAMPVLQRLQRRHVLLLVLFENTELTAAAAEPVSDVEGIYRRTIAAGFLHQKKQMALRASRAGIQTMLTKPEDLTLHTVNKYLELKARGMI
jgi:uncharacterized protein (DUF58 family)